MKNKCAKVALFFVLVACIFGCCACNKTFTVCFDTCGGEPLQPAFVDKGQSLQLPIPTKAGFEFLGWFDNSDCSGETLPSRYAPVQKEVTLFAKWKQLPLFTVSFNTNGGNAIDNAVLFEVGEITLPTPVREGYVFLGWYKSADFAGDALTGKYIPTSTHTLFAKWKQVVSYTLTYNTNGGGAISAETVDAVKEIALPVPTREGYSFLGWFESQDFSGEALTGKYVISATKTLYAKWQQLAICTLTFDTNGGDAIAPMEIFDTTEVVLPTPTRSGYAFDGWYASADFAGEAVASVAPTQNATYFAKWTQVATYTVKHLLQDVSGDGYTLQESSELQASVGATTQAVANTYTGFEAQTFEQTTVSADGSTVVEIRYNRKVFELKITINGHTDESQVRFGHVVNLAEISVEGYVVDYWQIDGEGEHIASCTVAANTNLVATCHTKPVETFDELVRFAQLGLSNIILSQNLTITQTVTFSASCTVVCTDDVTLLRGENFKGEMLVVAAGATVDIHPNANGNYSLIIDGNKSKFADADSAAIFVAQDAKLILRDAVMVANCKKVANNQTVLQLTDGENIGGAAAIVCGTLEVRGATICDCDASAGSTDNSNKGGAIYNLGTLVVAEGAFSGNMACEGGAIYSVGVLSADGADLSQNLASCGGAIAVADGSAKLADVAVTQNLATELGGGIYAVGGTLALNNCTVNKNDAASGGAVYLAGVATLNAVGGSFSQNNATRGGGLYATGGATLNIDGSAVEDNCAKFNGGGIFVADGATLYMHGAATVKSNMAYNGAGINFELSKTATAFGGLVIDGDAETALVVADNCCLNDDGDETFGGGLQIAVARTLSPAPSLNLVVRGNVQICENCADNGGGIFAAYVDTLTIEGATVQDNDAALGEDLYAYQSHIVLKNATVAGKQTGGVGSVIEQLDD